MLQPILRNDDVCAATTVEHLERFVTLTDKYGYHVVHGITPRGVCWASDNWLGSKTNYQICALGAGILLEFKPELIEFLKSRIGKDEIGIHGLWHTHRPSADEIVRARKILSSLGLEPTYFIPPFNEGNYKAGDIIVSAKDAYNFELEDEREGVIGAMHSWRYDPAMWAKAYGTWWTWDDLERRLREQREYFVMGASPSNEAKWAFLAPRIKGKWLDIGCNVGTLLDMVPNGIGIEASSKVVRLANRSDITLGTAESLNFPDGHFDTAVLCGVLEQCACWRRALCEARRVAKRVIGTAPYPGSQFGQLGATRWVQSVIAESDIHALGGRTERINDEHYYFEFGEQQ